MVLILETDQEWWHKPIIPAFQRLRQEDQSLSLLELLRSNPCLKTGTK